MSLGTILFIILILILLGVFPTWPHSASWGLSRSSSAGSFRRVIEDPSPASSNRGNFCDKRAARSKTHPWSGKAIRAMGRLRL
jgi:hypothetical protein